MTLMTTVLFFTVPVVPIKAVKKLFINVGIAEAQQA